ncbi:MAG: AraC family transcriptional regulator [Parvularcula sp.]|jgi:AraC-like DNA-binding protein|nr:AraC family transcriptional regulator [Parvularcula sp.]
MICLENAIETDASGSQWLISPHDSLDGTLASVASQFELIDRLAISGAPVVGVKVHIPHSLGEGSWKVVRTSPFMCVMIGGGCYSETRVMRVAKDRLAKARILLSGRLHQRAAQITLEGTGAFLEAYPENVSSDYELAAGVPFRLVVLNWDPCFFVDDLGIPADRLPAPIDHVFSTSASQARGTVTTLGLDIMRAANDIVNAGHRFSRELFRAYLDSKGREIACTMVADLGTKRTSPMLMKKYTVRDMKRLDEARDILIENYRDPPAIPELARRVGVNQTKLKALFKMAYGSTVHEFTQRLRMERASEMLSKDDLTIAEIAYAVGYEFPASFTHAFRKFYGHSPRQERKATQALPDSGVLRSADSGALDKRSA